MAQTIKLKRSSTGGAVPSTSSLSLGEVAINTYDGKMYIKKNDGTDAIVQVGGDSSSAVWKSYDYTATSNQTSFSGNDNNSESLSYVAGFVQVFLNGILLDPAVDYAASTGTSIVLTSGASTGDLLQIESFTQIIGTGDILVDTFPVSSTQTAFTLSQDPINKSNISVYVEGVYQESSTYSLSTTTLTLSESPANGTTVEVVIGTRNVTLDNIADLTISGTLHAGALDLGDANIINVNEISLDTIKGDADANTNITFAGSDVTTFTQGGQERLRLNTTGAEVTGNIVVSGTVDGRDVAADGVTADAALSRAGGAMGGAITTNSTFDGRDVSVDGTKLDGIESGATADQTDVEIRAAVESASDSNVFTNADHSKLDAIEALADVTDATNVTAAGALMRAGGTMTGNLSLGDNVKAQFGNQTNGDLQIYHDGNNSRVEDKGTGGLRLIGSNFVSMQSDSGENMVVGTANSDVTLYHNNSPKIATTSSGISVTGSVVADGLVVDGNAEISSTTPTLRFFETDQTDEGTLLRSAGDSFQIAKMLDTGAADGIRLAIDQSSGDISFYDSAGSSQNFYWDSSTSRLGLGVTNPATDLHIKNAGSTQLLLESGNTDTGFLLFGDAQDLNIGSISYNHSDNSMSFETDDATRLTINADGSSVFSGAVTSTGLTVASTAPKITIEDTDATSTHTKTELENSGGSLNFNTRQSNGTFVSTDYQILKNSSGATLQRWYTHGTEAFRLDSNQNAYLANGGLMVGSTTVPVTALDVLNGGNTYTSGLLLRNGTSTSEATSLYHDNTGSTTTVLANRYGNAASSIKLVLQAASASPVTALTALGNGNVNIPNGKIKVSATTAPVARVDIAGNSDTVPALKIGSGDTYGHFFYDSSATGDLVIKRGEGGSQSESMRLDRSTGNATFAGDITTAYGVQAGYFKIGSTVIVNSNRDLTNIGSISSGAITTSGNVSVGGSAYTTATDLNLLGDGISIKNDKAGSNNNWSLIQNTDTGSASNLSFTTGLGVALTLNHNKSATFGGPITGTTATAAGGTNTTALASTAFVQQELTTLIGGAPSTLNDLNELAAAINDDANYNTTLTTALATKLPKAGGTMTGTLAMGANAITSTGTISSGAINSSGAFSGHSVTLGYGATFTNGNTNFLLYNNTGDNLLYMRDATNGQMITTWYTDRFQVDKILRVQGNIMKGATVVMDASRNLTNIGTISSGAITTSGTFTGQNLNLRNDTAGDGTTIRDISFLTTAAQGSDDRIALIRAANQGGDGTTRGGKLTFYTRQSGSANFNSTLVLDKDAGATFAGTISSGAITSSGAISSAGVTSSNSITMNAGNLSLNSTSDGNQAFRYYRADGTLVSQQYPYNNRINFQTYNNQGLRLKSHGSGQIELEGNVVINEDSADVDFRVETNTSSHTLFIDGGTNNIGIHSGTEWALTGGGNASSSSGVSIDMSYDGTIYAGSSYWAGGLKTGTGFFSDASGDRYKRTSRQVTQINQTSQGGDMSFRSQTSGNAGAVISWHEMAKFTRSEVKFNDGGLNQDFRVASVGQSHMFFVDASQNRATFGQATASISSGGLYMDLSNDTQAHIGVCVSENASNVGGLYINRQNHDGPMIIFRRNNVQRGSIDVTTVGTTYNTTSDRRLKDNIETITDGTDKLMAMNPVTHGWKADPEADTVHGFIAQEMMEIIPEAVSGDPEGEEMMSMDYGRITPVIVAALQDALKEIKELKTRINELEAK